MKEPSAGPIASLCNLSEEVRQEALQRFYLLRPFLEEGVPLAALVEQHHLNLRTAQRWVTAYQNHGLSGLARQPRSDLGQRRDLPDELQKVIEGLALKKPPPSTASIYRQIKEVAYRQGWKVPSYSRVYNIVSQLEPGLVVLAHQGPKVYREEFDLLYRFEASRPNEIWQADHTLLDLWLLNDHGKPARPWLSTVIDDYSRAITGYLLSFQAPSALQTSLVFRQAIWRKTEANWRVCGIPEIFYTDHGSDFTSQHIEQVCADLKIQLIFSQVGIPRGRGKIERLFKTLNQLVLSTLPGYTLQEKAKEKAKLTLNGFENLFHHFLLEEYLVQPHSETRIAPLTRWEAGGFLPNLPDSLEQLDLLLLTVARTRQVQQDGIHFQGLRYLDTNLAAYVGEAVMIRYDPRDMAEIRVFHQNKFVCRAVCQELAEQTVSLKEIQAVRKQQRHKLSEQLKTHTSLVDSLMGIQTSVGQMSEANPDPPNGLKPEGADDKNVSPKRLKRYYNE